MFFSGIFFSEFQAYLFSEIWNIQDLLAIEKLLSIRFRQIKEIELGILAPVALKHFTSVAEMSNAW